MHRSSLPNPLQTAVLVVAVLAAACEPVFVFAGGALAGTVYPVPDDWAHAAAEEVVQLETRPADPYSVNVWGVGVGAYFYVATDSATTWAQAMAEDPRVRLRVAERVYPLSASRVADAAELDAVVAAYVAKYDLDADDDFPRNVAVFRLAARQSP